MTRFMASLGRLSRSLYARIALVYLISLLLLSATAAWIAVSQFSSLSREFEQRMEIDLARNLLPLMQPALAQGPQSAAAMRVARRVGSINPSLHLYVLDASGHMVGNYARTACPTGARVDTGPLEQFLGEHPMLPVFVAAPCSNDSSVFSVARIRYGPTGEPGYLLALFNGDPGLSMFSMLRTSSVTHTLIATGVLALIVSGVVGLLLFALMTRRFSALTDAVRRFADSDYSQRIKPGRNDEIGLLARAFNGMAATIEAQLNALRENDRQRRDLVAGLSHDFRTPLTSLRGYAEQLRASDGLTPAARQAHLEAILTNTDRLTRLAQQLSTLARVDASEQALCIEPFPLSELAWDIAGKFTPQARTANVTLAVRCTPQAISVMADIALIDRALANLVDNALQATAPGGHVDIDIATQANNAIVRVIDTGVGIHPDELKLVTQRFYRTTESRGKREGSGLGLAIVQEICARHGTRLVIQSTPGQGTTTQFTLPLAHGSGAIDQRLPRPGA